VYIVVAVLAAVGLYVGVQVLENPLAGVLIAALCVLGGLYLLNRETADGDGFFSTPEARRTSEIDDDDDDDDDKRQAPPSRPRASTATAEPLATWEGEGLAAWTPPETDEKADDEIELDAEDLAELDHIDDFFDRERDRRPRVVEDQPEPAEEITDLDLDELLDSDSGSDEFDAFDPDAFSKDRDLDEDVAEHDDLGMFDEIQQIEDVHSDDDIMKASEATSLEHTGAAGGGGDNSELAKLLAKVQSRLAAYE
jgi:hypothetical protein